MNSPEEIIARGYRPFRMVKDDHVLVPGRRIVWLGANGIYYEATIISGPGFDISYEVQDDGETRRVNIYIERIKFYGEVAPGHERIMS